MKRRPLRAGLLATTTFCAVIGAAAMVPAMASAQDAAPAADAAPTEVIVTGSILRKKNLTSISPLTVLGSADLEKRGVTTIESAVQNLAGNNGGAMNNNWSSAGGFAAGASGISLRGLTTNSTLVLVDGMRLTYYPLADDATRNFVDLNTIPDAIIDRIEVLQDGASSTYGADAIAGVVNVITKKQFTGFSGKATVGSAEHKGAGVAAISGIWGKGDLSADGYNFYVSAEFQKDEALRAADAGFPYNTANQSSVCAPSVYRETDPHHSGVNAAGYTCRTNGIVNGLQFTGALASVGSTTVATVRPFDATNSTAMGNWQLLNPALGCGDLTPITLAAGQTIAGTAVGTTLCQLDATNKYNVVQPEDTRKSLSARFTKNFSDTTQGYVEVNLYQNEVAYGGRGGPRTIQSVTTPGAAGTSVSLAGIALPVYVCPRGTTVACTASNGTLNAQNPFAGLGQVARINYLFGDLPYMISTDSRTYRLATGLSGTAFDWKYNVDFTADKSELDYDKTGVPNLQHIRDVVADGSYNFMDPSQNSQAVRDYVAPKVHQHSDSELVQLQASASRDLMSLAGGPLQLGLGTSFRYERVNNPSINPDRPGANPYDRYSNASNPFGAVGFRHVTSAYFEIDAPFTPTWDVNLGGRYDDYSTGFSNFSPKISSSWKVFDTLTLRGTFSKGFRAPSIAENNSDPSTGFVTLQAPTSFQEAHGNNGYGASYSLGLTTVAAKDLKPETSDGTTLGFVWQATKNIAFTVDYFKIHKKGVIAGGDYTHAIAAYFAGTAIPEGFTVTPGVVDPLNPTLLATPGFVQYGLVNLNSQDIAGMDASVFGRFNLGSVKWTSSLDASYIQYYTQSYEDGTTQRYDGTLGNNQITSGSGTPKLKGNWTNSFDFGKATLAATIYYTSGYKAIATDNGDDYYGTCAAGSTAVKYRDGATVVNCNVAGFAAMDLHGSYKLTENYTIMLDVLNAFATRAPYDPSGTYGISLYNPAFTSSGMMGRYWKLTGKVTF